MTAAGWDSAERWYRRLLWSYPAHYRRRHGAEILTTLMESAEPERRLPAPADAVDLLRGGLRQRLRLPAGRPLVLLAAMFAVVVFGAFGAAAGSWLGERTLSPLPSADAARTLVDQVVDGQVKVSVQRSTSTPLSQGLLT